MASKALQIRDAVLALLRASPCGGVPANRVLADQVQATASAGGAFIVVDLGDEPPPEPGTLVHAFRRVDLRVQVVALGIDPHTLADAPLVEAHARIMADRTLGGLAEDIVEGPRQRQREDLERPAAAVETLYSIAYRTAFASLET